MKIILLKNLDSLGQAGDIKGVSDGYAMNYLLPQKLAVVATEANIALHRNKQAQVEKQVEKKTSAYQKIAKTLDKQILAFFAKVSDKEILFKAINNKDIIKAIKDKFNLDIEDKWFKTAVHLKKIGKHQVAINFPDKNKINLTIDIKPEK
ncbi:50S ribosomal protein L9 [bacterium]|jgi:large subunit ribosomal protein L9|nr:50S ribosomal protein L9 [bacterium]